jgi:hypothetical protein
MFKDEPSYRCHVNMNHHLLNEHLCSFAELITMGKSLKDLDFKLLGDTSPRD